ncbi:acyl-CoA dehydrogenase family protein [Streptomyces griseorubiginosus]|uniref:acyl-CoA dehydrogenase family protein n=1 Tax=Streptomyces griseorubiginosus TaxID=67304 RepID=UPI0033BD8C95
MEQSRLHSYRIPFVQACLAGLSDDAAQAWFREVEDVIDDSVAPHAEAVDRDAFASVEALDALRHVGVFGVQVPRRFGGLGLDDRAAALVVEQVARRCASTAAVLMFHYQVVRRTLTHGSRAQRDDDLAAFASGERIAASAWTEAASGKGKRNVATVLRQTGKGWQLEGEKTFCTGLPVAAVVHVLAKAEPAGGSDGSVFVRVDTKDPGVNYPQLYPLLGLRGSGTGTLTLRAIPVTDADLVGPIGSGGALMRENHQVCLNPGLLALGVAGAALDTALGMCTGQLPGTVDRVSNDTVRRTLAQAAVQVESAYLYGAHAVSRGNTSQAHVLTSKFKLAATAAAQQVATELMAAVGSRGFVASFPLERHFRDAQATSLMGPANDVITDRIADDLTAGRRNDLTTSGAMS